MGGSSTSLTPVQASNDHGPSQGRARTRPNNLLIMTDQERSPPAYGDRCACGFWSTQLPARERLRAAGLEQHRHDAGSAACLPSRATLFTGHCSSLHRVTKSDGLAKPHNDPAMRWLDPAGVPTLGSHEGLKASDDNDAVIPTGVAAYNKGDQLDPFGFSGWIGREPHGAAKADSGSMPMAVSSRNGATPLARPSVFPCW